MKYRYEILLLFVVFEVLLYDSDRNIQTIISIVEYTFIAISVILSRKLGIMYYISFTLLSLGTWSYVTQSQELLPANFWGIRLFGYSLNFVFSVAIFIFCMFSKNMRIRLGQTRLDYNFFILFTLYSCLTGIFSVVFSINYFDNFLRDTSVYIPLFIYIYFVSVLDSNAVFKIFQYGISLTVVTMMLSLLTGNLFDYGSGGYKFVLMNSFGFIVIFAIFFLKDIFFKTHYYLLSSSVIFLFATGNIFTGGKFIIIVFILLLWLLLNYRKILGFTLTIIIVIYILQDPILRAIEDNFNESMLITYKFTQIFSIFDFTNIDTMASAPTSMGNIFAEGRTIYNYLLNNRQFLFLGKGFGGGIQDVFGYFAPIAGPTTAYTYLDVARNDYFRMHLPIFEIVIKAGIFGLWFYIILLFRSFKAKNIYSFIYFILIFTVFFNSKEMMLLTLLCMKLSIYYTNSYHKEGNREHKFFLN